MKTKLLMCLASVLFLASCSTTKENNLAYFKNLGEAESGVITTSNSDFVIKIQPDDELIITVTSSQPEASAAYNMPLDNPARRGSLTAAPSQARQQTYIVDKQGYINFPVLGKIKVSGKTTDEITADITKGVSEQVKDPYVRVELISFSVNVMGEVENPHRISVYKQRYSVLDALAEAGDLTEFARRDKVVIIRDEAGQKTYHRINLQDTDTFNSPYFYLQQNDVVYVEPNSIKIDNSKYNQNNAYKLTVLSTVVSAVSVIASLVIALTVK